MKRKLIATATFGLEAIIKREIINLGYKVLKVEDGKVTYEGDDIAIARSNLWLRCADRVLMLMGEFSAETFEELYQQTKAINWPGLIPVDGRFTVNGVSVKSQLSSVPACQKIVKKAIVDSMADFYCIEKLVETGAEYMVKVSILKNKVTLTVDTSGSGLHKRGYRVKDVAAPIKETLAAAMIQLSFWKPGRILVDPCCGSGTIPIEAALMRRNRAPGINRGFVSEQWDSVGPDIYDEERKKARSVELQEELGKELCAPIILGYDIDADGVMAARANAKAAGVEEDIEFSRRDIIKLSHDGNGGIIITNPPYGMRIGEEKDIVKIYRALGQFYEEKKDWSLFFITTDKGAEHKVMKRPADRRRKLYNGRLEVCYYQFHGEKPEDMGRIVEEIKGKR